ncbi:hypothetical protein MAM1_0056c03616 [Mucor ambiguus]|uniref:Homeodomain-like DNA binding domain-containing transcription factor n=1 Tax=Mucor ambiguus TaxID=91626 RepID=A0A0C9M4H1_9FUNG|nr:hypothetical protein MAM1_0056c03616 [Mucor ambiguus]
MEDVLTQVNDPNIVLETIISRETYLKTKRPEKPSDESSSRKQLKSTNLKPPGWSYNTYSDFTRESFIDRMLESPQEHGLIAKIAKDLNINYRTAVRWWHFYEETEEIAYKKSELNSGRISSFTAEHNKHINELLDNDPQLYSDDIIKSLTEQFEGCKISKAQMNTHLRNTMLITIKKPTFEPEVKTQLKIYRQDMHGLWTGETQTWILQETASLLMKPVFI